MHNRRPPIPVIIIIVLLLAVAAYFIYLNTEPDDGQLTASGTSSHGYHHLFGDQRKNQRGNGERR
jgi:hypothetical protein